MIVILNTDLNNSHKMKRRTFLRNSLISGTGISALSRMHGRPASNNYDQLVQAMKKPVLHIPEIKDPVILDKVELLRYRNNFICRVTTKEGSVGISVSNNMQMVSLYSIFTERIQPFFIGKDARRLEDLLEEVYVFKSNYKLQSLAIWVPLATLEFAVLDFVGKNLWKTHRQFNWKHSSS